VQQEIHVKFGIKIVLSTKQGYKQNIIIRLMVLMKVYNTFY